MAKRRNRSSSGWIWPLGVLAAGIAGASTLVLRGCWHADMSWPRRVDEHEVRQHGDEEYSYQVCTKCGIKRLYDEHEFRAYGPYSYDLHELIARDRAARMKWERKHREAV